MAYPLTAYAALTAMGRDLDKLAAGRVPPGTAEEAPVDPVHADDPMPCRLALEALAEIEASIRAAVQRWGPPRVGIVVVGRGGPVREPSQPEPEVTATQHAVQTWARTRGPSMAVIGDAVAGAKALAVAQRWLRAELVDAVLVVGSAVGRARAPDAAALWARPLCLERNGAIAGWGAAALLFERQGNSETELRAVAEHRGADALSKAIRSALEQARTTPQWVDWVYLDVDADPRADAEHAHALTGVLGTDKAAVATSGGHGDLGPMALLHHVALTAAALGQGSIPPSWGSTPVDPRLGLRVSEQAIRSDAETVLLTTRSAFDEAAAVVVGVREP